MTDVIDELLHNEQLQNFTNGLGKRLLLLLLTNFTNNIGINKIENRFMLVGHITKLLSKIRKPMLTIIFHFSRNQATTERILEVEELLPQSTANWCLNYLLEWEIIKVQYSVKDYRGRNFKIYLLNDTTQDTVSLIERKHIDMYHKLSSKWKGEAILEAEKEMLLFYCLECKETRLDANYPQECVKCGCKQMVRGIEKV